MPPSDRAAQIRLEDQVRQLLERVAQLEIRVAELEAEKEDQFELVSEVAATPTVAAASAPVLPIAATPVPTINPRLGILQDIGKWIKGCLEGNRRGLSGRDRLKESNSIYLVFKDFAGKFYNPPVIFYRWAEVSRIVKPRGDPGDSIFVGLPNADDVTVVAAAAGVSAPLGA